MSPLKLAPEVVNRSFTQLDGLGPGGFRIGSHCFAPGLQHLVARSIAIHAEAGTPARRRCTRNAVIGPSRDPARRQIGIALIHIYRPRYDVFFIRS
jgi:hypothetical protein